MEKFTGQIGTSGFAIDAWLREVDKQFAHYGAAEFPNDATKIAFAVQWMTGDAQTWWENEDQASISSWSVFVSRMRDRYRPQMPAELARQKLRLLKQRGRCETYCNEFLKLAALLPDRCEDDKIFDFKQGLDQPLAAKVAEGKPKTLQEAMELAVQAEPYVGGRSGSGFQFRSPSFRAGGSGSSTAMDVSMVAVDAPEPDTQADQTIAELMSKLETMEQRLSAIQQSPGSRSGGFQRQGGAGGGKSTRVPGRTSEDIQRMRKEGRCFLCGDKGHMKSECPKKPKNS